MFFSTISIFRILHLIGKKNTYQKHIPQSKTVTSHGVVQSSLSSDSYSFSTEQYKHNSYLQTAQIFILLHFIFTQFRIEFSYTIVRKLLSVNCKEQFKQRQGWSLQAHYFSLNNKEFSCSHLCVQLQILTECIYSLPADRILPGHKSVPTCGLFTLYNQLEEKEM